MATCDYFCEVCEETKKVHHKITENPSVKCDFCGNKMLRIVHFTGLIEFHGSGFYETDYEK